MALLADVFGWRSASSAAKVFLDFLSGLWSVRDNPAGLRDRPRIRGRAALQRRVTYLNDLGYSPEEICRLHPK
jgi:hypothetical protein